MLFEIENILRGVKDIQTAVLVLEGKVGTLNEQGTLSKIRIGVEELEFNARNLDNLMNIAGKLNGEN